MPANKFLVTPEYCNGKTMTNHHHTIHTAALEYADRIVDALEPSLTAPEAPHMRKVTLEIIDTRKNRKRSVDSGVFECEHSEA